MKFAADDTEFTDKRFTALIADGQEFYRTSFLDCQFSDSSFREAKFYHCRFDECTFVACDLSLIDVEETEFVDTSFTNCKLLGVNWTTAAIGRSLLNLPLSFSECDLSYSTFIGLSLHKMRLLESVAREVDFSDADLVEADFGKTMLAGSRFQNTNLTKANFRGATEYSIDSTSNTITKAKFSLPEAVSLLRYLDIDLEE